MTSIDILGCRIDAVGRDAAVQRITELAQGTTPSLVVTVGVEMVMYAQRNFRFRNAINRAALALCDTIGILLASRLRGGPLVERVTGVDLIEPLVARSALERDLRLFFLGGSAGVAEGAAAALRARHPGAQIVGTLNGYFTPEKSAAIADTIARSSANVVLAGLGSPKQEYWLDEYLAATGCAVGIGVGGSFDVFAGTVQRAPPAIQRVGLEWLYRLCRQPSRWRRQLALPQFAVAATREALTLRSMGRR